MDCSNLPPWFPLIDDKLKSAPACLRKEIKETLYKSKQMENALIAVIGSMPGHKVSVKLSEAHGAVAKLAREHGGRIGVFFAVEDDNDTVTISLESPPIPDNTVPFIKPQKQ